MDPYRLPVSAAVPLVFGAFGLWFPCNPLKLGYDGAMVDLSCVWCGGGSIWVWWGYHVSLSLSREKRERTLKPLFVCRRSYGPDLFSGVFFIVFGCFLSFWVVFNFQRFRVRWGQKAPITPNPSLLFASMLFCLSVWFWLVSVLDFVCICKVECLWAPPYLTLPFKSFVLLGVFLVLVVGRFRGRSHQT